MAQREISGLFLRPTDSIRSAIECINRNRQGVALVVDEEQHLLGTVTDGDIRRALLENEPIAGPVTRLLERKKGSAYAQPVTAEIGTAPEACLRLMQSHSIQHLPLLDEAGRVVALADLASMIPRLGLPVQGVVMAGGYGKRLMPLTQSVPKPMLPVGDRPLLERTVQQLAAAGVQLVNISTHYHADTIRDHFGDGSEFGVAIKYLSEEQPLGTAGALRLIEATGEPLLVVNGDILTNVDFAAMYRFHCEHKADLTVGVRQYGFQVPYGVLECTGPKVHMISEKPEYVFFVNAGIYLLQPGVRDQIPQGRHFDMPDLIQSLMAKGGQVLAFPIIEYWLDIGQLDDYRQAQEDSKEGRV